MLTLEGHDAVILLVAKGGLPNAGDTYLKTLQVAFAVIAGLSQPSDVRIGDVLRIVAKTHDLLTKHNLLSNPAQSMIDSMSRAYMLTNEKNPPSAPDVILGAMMGNIACMRIQSENGIKLIDWKTNISPSFIDDADALVGKE